MPRGKVLLLVLAFICLGLAQNAEAFLDLDSGGPAYSQKVSHPDVTVEVLFQATRRGLAATGRVAQADALAGRLSGSLGPYKVAARVKTGLAILEITGRVDGKDLRKYDPTAMKGPGMQRDKASLGLKNPDAGLTREQREMVRIINQWRAALESNLRQPQPKLQPKPQPK